MPNGRTELAKANQIQPADEQVQTVGKFPSKAGYGKNDSQERAQPILAPLMASEPDTTTETCETDPVCDAQ